MRALATRIAVRGVLSSADNATAAAALCARLLDDPMYEVRSAVYATTTAHLASVTDPYVAHFAEVGVLLCSLCRRQAAAAVARVLCEALLREGDHGALWRLLRLVRRMLLAGVRSVELAVSALSVSVDSVNRAPTLTFAPAVAQSIAAVVSEFLAQQRESLWSRLSPLLADGHPVKLRAHCIAFLGAVVLYFCTFRE